MFIYINIDKTNVLLLSSILRTSSLFVNRSPSILSTCLVHFNRLITGSFSSSILRLSSLFTAEILLTQLFSQTCCCLHEVSTYPMIVRYVMSISHHHFHFYQRIRPSLHSPANIRLNAAVPANHSTQIYKAVSLFQFLPFQSDI